MFPDIGLHVSGKLADCASRRRFVLTGGSDQPPGIACSFGLDCDSRLENSDDVDRRETPYQQD